MDNRHDCGMDVGRLFVCVQCSCYYMLQKSPEANPLEASHLTSLLNAKDILV
ncbi:MAG: hypothetical protein Q4A89_05880 [Tannerella sp.]|nr:hypothetical protein [Tannerella sp.]MDO4703449.1 hypothetical protein [Tannerella sp.]